MMLELEFESSCVEDLRILSLKGCLLFLVGDLRICCVLNWGRGGD